MDAIVYTSNTGTTAEYAALLGSAVGLPVYPLSDCSAVKNNAEIIYLGWLSAGAIKGYQKAARLYRIRAVCAVGMAACGSQIPEVTKRNSLGDTPLFTLQGGFDITKLHGIYRFMMKTMIRTVGKSLEKKADLTPDEADMLDLMKNGGNRVSLENLAPVLKWWQENQ